MLVGWFQHKKATSCHPWVFQICHLAGSGQIVMFCVLRASWYLLIQVTDGARKVI